VGAEDASVALLATVRCGCLAAPLSAPRIHRGVFIAGASPTGSPTSAPTNVGDTNPPTRLVDPCIYARDGACDVPSRCPVGDWEDCSTASTQPCIRRPTVESCRSATHTSGAALRLHR
jgi:hypothetical protein